MKELTCEELDGFECLLSELISSEVGGQTSAYCFECESEYGPLTFSLIKKARKSFCGESGEKRGTSVQVGTDARTVRTGHPERCLGQETSLFLQIECVKARKKGNRGGLPLCSPPGRGKLKNQRDSTHKPPFFQNEKKCFWFLFY